MFRIKPFHVLLAVFSIVIASCTKNDSAFTIGDNLIDIKSNVISVDTTSIYSYTFKADSVQTSGYNKALIGRYTDGVFGTITSSSYFQLGITSTLALAENARYDSITLSIKPNGYCYGDSTKPWTLQVHQLTEDVVNTELTYRFNVSKLGFDSTILGSRTFTKKPLAGQLKFIRLSDQFGTEIFNMIKNLSDTVSTQENFNRFFKGVALTTDTSNASAIYRFDIADSITYIRLHFHVGPDPKSIDFKLINPTYQYNRIETNYTNSSLKVLKKQTDLLPTRETNNESYCQAGTGIMTRIEFPNLNALYQTYENYKVLKAELIIKPVKNTYSLMPLPNPIYLYFTDDLNNIGSIITNGSSSSSNSVTPYLTNDVLYNEQTNYSFNITYYINYILHNLKGTPPALIVSLPMTNLGYNTDRLIIGDHQHPTNDMRLKITFWKY